MAKDSAAPTPAPDPDFRAKRHLGAQTVGGVHRAAGRTQNSRPSHYLSRAESRALGHQLDEALAARERRRAGDGPTRPGSKPATVGEHRALTRQADEARRARACRPAGSLTRGQRAQRRLPIFIHAALDDADLGANQFRVYAHLARQAHNRRRQAECDVEGMAAKCKLHPDTVRACLKVLLARRMIAVEDRPGQARLHRLTHPSAWGHPPETEGGVHEGEVPRKRPGMGDLNFRRHPER